MSNMMELNCLVLGDDINRIFQVELSPTRSIAHLREEIKVKNEPAFNHIAANSIILWNVSVPIDENLKHTIASLGLVEEGALSMPVKKLEAIFSPVTDYLHVVIKPPPLPPTSLELNCWVIGEPWRRVFPVEIAAIRTVGSLKEKIKGMMHAFKYVDADSLTLWNVSKESIVIGTEIETKVSSLGLTEEVSLHPLNILSDVISDLPAGSLHIVIKAQESAAIISPLHRSQAASFSGWQPPLMPRYSSDPPIIPPHVSFRKKTVEGLYDALMKERLIYVRGPPGSGKSTLLGLLHQHILEKDPNAFVRVTRSWPSQNIPLLSGQDMALTYLQAIIPDFSQRTSLTFLLMDDAQDSFEDSYLWNKFLKDIIYMPSYYRVVVFCSYGSTTTPAEGTSRGTPVEIRPAARMTLWPRKVREEVEVNGLLLDWNEFNEVVKRFNKELLIDPDLSRTIFNLTVGHVGAVCELLRIILDQMKTRIRTEGPVRVDYEAFSCVHIMSRLSGPFARGLPTTKVLSERPEVSDLFRRLLVSGRVRGNDTAIQYCHRKGWLYAEDKDQLNPEPQYYTFASPFHHAALSWRLPPRDCLPLSMQKFMPSQMIRRVGGGDPPPEAQ